MLIPDTIDNLIIERRTTKKALCEAIGISQQSLNNLKTGTEIGVNKLEAIADYFGVSMDYFFGREDKVRRQVGHSVCGNGSSIHGDIVLDKCKQEVEHLKELLAEKERTIQLLLSINDINKEKKL